VGGYFFVDYYNANDFGRYNQTVYMPCTGEYHGNKSDYSDMSVSNNFSSIRAVRPAGELPVTTP